MRICVSGGKGGTGKTVVAANLGVVLAENKKTMLVDADAECPNTHIAINAKRKFHSSVTKGMPVLDKKKCLKCGACAKACRMDAIVFVDGKYPAFVKDRCIGCGACRQACPQNAIKEKKKRIGTIYTSKRGSIFLVSSELKLGELASGEVVAKVREEAEAINQKQKAENIVIDSAAGVGCPVIGSMRGTDFVVCVAEPTPSGFHDMKRTLFLAKQMKIRRGIVINKQGLSRKTEKEIEKLAERQKIPLLGKIPFDKKILDSVLEQKPVAETSGKYWKIFGGIARRITGK